jgi:hypothetical protein
MGRPTAADYSERMKILRVRHIVTSCIVVLPIVLGAGAFAQPEDGSASWRGHLVQAKGTTMIFRAEDDKTYAVDMSAVDTGTWHPFELGQAVTLAAKRGPGSQTLIAARIEPEQPGRSGRPRANRSFRTMHGIVEKVEGSEVTVRTTGGKAVSLNVPPTTGGAEFHVNDRAVLTLEQGGNTAVWIDRR